jgi:hypothetical protein
MPKIDFTEGFKKKSAFDYPKLSLDQNEKARVCIIDSPIMEYVHQLRKVITEGGKPIMETQKYGKNFDRTREVPQTEFVGKFICLGDADTLENKGVDPDSCPACKASIENGAAVDQPRRRFVVHVIKYQTNKGTFNLQKPFQVELMAWEFTENRFSALVDIVAEHGSLPQIDLCLGPCTAKNFQKYDIIPGGSCQWGADEDRKTRTKEVVTANRSDDLTPLLGRRVSDTELRSVVNEIVQQYNYAFGRNDSMPTANTNADNDLSGLLDDPKPEAEAEKKVDPWAGGPTDTNTSWPDTEQPTVSEVTKTDATPAPAKEKDEIEDLESLLSGL